METVDLAKHDRAAMDAISRAIHEIPFYARHREKMAGERLEDVLPKLPLLFKKDVRKALPKAWVPAGRDVRAELESGDLELVETSGSTEDRLNILWDRDWWLRQEERSMRTNPLVDRAMSGAFGPYKEAILTTPVCGGGVCHIGDLTYEERLDEHRIFLNMRADPTFWLPDDKTRMLDEIERHGTVGLEADPAYLAALSLHAHALGRRVPVHASGFTQLTYASTTAAHVRSIRKAYDGTLVQLYGASEVGVLFMEGDDGLLHHSPITTHVELLPAKVPTPGAKDVALVVVTTLDRIAQPLLRFVVGDLVQVDWNGPRRFSPVPPLVSIEGRVQDALLRRDGGLVTTGALDRALEPLVAIEQYQARQADAEHVEVDVVVCADARASSIEADARERLVPLLGDGVALDVRRVTAVAPEPSGKFRVSKREVPLDVTKIFGS
jgi:phenylacetate-CoA ligase